MLNSTGVLAILDRGITINWDDGATLHKIGAQVRYRVRDSAAPRLLRVSAGKRASEEPLVLVSMDEHVRASWLWVARAPGWSAQVAVTNTSDDEIYLDSIDVVRIDSAFGGLFNLGAPPGLWRCAKESGSAPIWESFGDSPASASGFLRARRLLVQPSASNRTSPPAVLVCALGGQSGPGAEPVSGTELALPTSDIATEIQLEITGEKFERLSARCRLDGMMLGAGVTVATRDFWIASGDDASELMRLEPGV